MKRASRLSILLGLVVPLALAACGDDDPVSSKSDESTAEFASRLAATAVGRTWELTAFIDGEQTARAVGDTPVTLYLDAAGQAAGSTGCNQCFGAYALGDSGRITFSGLGATEMACMGAGVMEQEQRYLRSLAAATAATLSGEYLHLLYGDGDAYMRFAPAAQDNGEPAVTDPDSTAGDSTAVYSADLQDRVWKLRFFEYQGDGGPVSDAVPADVEITAVFSAAGEVRGRAGCNEYFGRYETGADGGLAIGDVGLNEMFCQTPELMEWEERYRDLLDDIDAYRVEGERLAVSYGDGSGVLHFEESGDPVEPTDPPAVVEDSVWVDDAMLRYEVHACAADPTLETRSSKEPVASADGGDLYFALVIETYCNAQTDDCLNLEPVIDGTQITINAVFRGPAVRCLCPIPVRGVVEGLEPGTYTVTFVYGVELQGGTHLEPEILSEVEVVVGEEPSSPVAPQPDPEPLPADLHLTASDHGDTIELTRPGAIVEVALESNPSTGYTWLVADVDSTILLIAGELFEAGNDGLVGAPGTQRLYFEAVAPGQTTLRLVYARPWESVMPADTFEVSFAVNGGIVPLPPDQPVPPLGIRLGSSFGECLGYCWQEMLLDEESMVLVARSRDEAQYPEKVYEEKMDPELWRRLQSVADFAVLDGMEEVYGCPDCADGGAEWVTMNLSGRIETVKFEYGAKLEPIAEVLKLLRYARDGLVERAGF